MDVEVCTERVQRKRSRLLVLSGIFTLLLAGGFSSAQAATVLCVNPSGTGGCYSSISDAVADASPGDTIQVASGIYQEHVVIPMSLSLIGQNQQNTIIDATNESFGIIVDGYDNPGLSNVVVSGFTVMNAENAGILVYNASDVTIEDNKVVDNDQGLTATGCTTLGDFPYFIAGETADCGEGIMFSGVDHSAIANNTVTRNAGGLLITDDTGPTYDNLITGNYVVKNTHLDCGITLPSHLGGGVFDNTVSENNSSYNGGPGVGIFAPVPGSAAYANVVIDNTLRGNGLPGVTMHNHLAPGMGPFPPGATPAMFNDNEIIGNDISENAQDTDDAATSGPTGINIYSVTPMTGTVISQNTIHQESLDIVVKVPAPDSGNAAAALVHLNDLANRVGLENDGAGTVDATENWWGCTGGPGAHGCSIVDGSGVSTTPWLSLPFKTGNGQ